MKKLKKLLGLLAVSSMAIVGVGCSSTTEAPKDEVKQEVNAQEEVAQEVVKVTHEYGEVEVPKNPKSVVVTDFGILDTIQALGVESVTGVSQDASSVPSYLKDYTTDKYVNVGGLKEPDFEALYELQPEVIFIAGRQANQYEELSKIAPVVYISTDIKDYIGSLEKNVTLLGEIFGKEKEAEEIMTKIRNQADEVKALAEEQDANALITMVNKGEVSVFGEASRFGIIHNTLGIKPADTNIEESTHGQVGTFEYLLEVNPQYLFVVDRNAIDSGDVASQAAKDTLNNELVNKMSAAKEDKIIYLDPIAWYITSGGIQATEIMIQEVQEALELGK